MKLLHLVLGICLPWIIYGGPGGGTLPAGTSGNPVSALVGGIVPPLASLAFLGSPKYLAGVLSGILKGLFNAKFQVKPYPRGDKNRRPIKCPNDLFCDFAKNGTKCRWRNVIGDGGRRIFVETNAEPAKLNKNWSIIMGNSERPKKPYAVTGAVVSSVPVGIWFVSDPIPKQPKDGKVKLKYWLSPPTTMRACVRGLKRPNFLSCSKKLKTSSKAYGEMKVNGPIDEPFEIVLETADFKSKKGSLAVFDDIKYESDLCDD